MTAWCLLWASILVQDATVQNASVISKRPEFLGVRTIDRPIAVDGCVEKAEWDVAIGHATAASGRLLLARHGGCVFIGVDSKADGIVSVFIAKGDRITVLHASYSLGTASYTGSGNQRKRAESFAWERPEVIAGKTSSAIENNLTKRGWSGTRIDTGHAGSAELVIGEAMLTAEDSEGPVRVAISFFDLSDERTAWTWPDGLTDAATSAELQKGEVPATLEFRTEDWGVLRLLPPAEKGGSTND